jgi:hypothetical protein
MSHAMALIRSHYHNNHKIQALLFVLLHPKLSNEGPLLRLVSNAMSIVSLILVLIVDEKLFLGHYNIWSFEGFSSAAARLPEYI